MKKLISLFLLSLSFSVFSQQNYTSIFCESAKGALQGYPDSGRVWEIDIGCNPTSQCAVKKLNSKLTLIPEKNSAVYSSFFEDYIEVKSKVVSKLTIDSVQFRSTGLQCKGSSGGYDSMQVDCNQSTACVTVQVSYDICKKVSYDPRTGNKTVTCPSGRVIKESN